MLASDYVVSARSTATFGRVLMQARTNHLVVDGPVRNGCPGEAVTPAELFLGGVATCAVELIAVIARERGIALASVDAEIGGTIDRSAQTRADVTLFTSVALRLTLHGPSDEEASDLVAAFTSR